MSRDGITRARGIALASLILLGCEDDIVIYDDFSSLSGEWTSTWEYWQAGSTSWVLTLEEHGDGPLTGTYVTDYSFKADVPRPDTLRGMVRGDYDSREGQVFLAFTMMQESVRLPTVSCELRAWVDQYEENMGGVLDCTPFPQPLRTGHPIILKLTPGSRF